MALQYICSDCRNTFGMGNFDKQKGKCLSCSRMAAAIATVEGERQAMLNAMADDLVTGNSGEKKQVVDAADIKK